MPVEHDLILELLDHLWVRKGLTKLVKSASVTEELGALGEGQATLSADDPLASLLPDPDAADRYEGRWRLYEDDEIAFAGVIDAKTVQLNESRGEIAFNGKSRGIELSWENFGRRDILGWPTVELYTELLRRNIGKAPMASAIGVTSQNGTRPALNAITGDPFKNQYYLANVDGSEGFTIDTGRVQRMDAIRVIPPWWDGYWYTWTIETSPDNSTWTLRGSKTTADPSNDRGRLVELGAITARYVRVRVTDSTDGRARMAAVLVLQNILDVGAETDFNVPFIENDDSGNVTTSGTTSRPIVNGAFTGDGITGNSLVTRLDSGAASIEHIFRGTAEGVYMTQAEDGDAEVEVFIDGVSQGTFTAHDGKYQEEVFKVEGLDPGPHTCEVVRVSGTPQIDYFTGLYEASWRAIREDEPAIAYSGTWEDVEDEDAWNFAVKRSKTTGARAVFEFYGDAVKVIGNKGVGHGSVDWYIDGVLQGTVDLENASKINKQTWLSWTGTFGAHTLRIETNNTEPCELDRIQGNFSHVIYMRSAYDHNLFLLTRFSEILNSYLRFNFDGTVDMLGVTGTESGITIREGENEGGTIISADKNDDYKETISAVIALVNGPNDMPIKSFVIDKEAVAEIGLKVGKYDGTDAVDAFLLTRQAWQHLQDHKRPIRRYTIQHVTEHDDEDVPVGENARLYSPTLGLNGDSHRIGRKVKEWSSGS